jgi:hypothetical protein
MISANISGLYKVYGHALLEVKSNTDIKYITLDKYTNNDIETWKCWHWNSDESHRIEYLIKKHEEDLSQEVLCIGDAIRITNYHAIDPSEWLDYSKEVKAIAHEWLQSNDISDFIVIHFRGTDFAKAHKNFVSFERAVPIVESIY